MKMNELKEKVVLGLTKCLIPASSDLNDETPCETCPYDDCGDVCVDILKRDALKLLSELDISNH